MRSSVALQIHRDEIREIALRQRAKNVRVFGSVLQGDDTEHQHQPSKSSASRKHAKREQEPWLLVVSPSLKAFSAARVVAYYRSRMQIEEGLRDTKSTQYGLDFTSESRIEAERRANLLLIAALIIFALWLTGLCLKGTDIERHIKVNSSQDHSPYSVIFLARIACRYVAFELSASRLEQAQALLLDYFDSFEGG
jgi:hypothetical protein